MKKIALLIVCISIFTSLFAQVPAPKVRKITRSLPPYTYEHTVLKSDSSTLHGWSKTMYKGRVVEQGNYANNECVGKWQFFSFKGIFDYEFNFDTNEVTKISGVSAKPPFKTHPSLFLGSPIIPHLFIVHNVFYPQRAIDENIKGAVTVALQISPEGKVVSSAIEKGGDKVLNDEVIKAVRKFPKEWRWVPALDDNKPIADTYRIVVFFDLE